MDHLDSVVQLREGIDRASKSFESLARTSEVLPAQVRKEFDAALESFSASQDKIRPTIQETQKALASADQAAQGIQRSAAELQKTAVAWESTVHAIEDLLKAYRELMPPRKEAPAGAGEPEKAEKGPTPEDITKIAVEIRTATLELRGLLDDIGSGKLSTAVSRIGETSNASIEHASGQMEKLIAWATMGGLILIAASLGAFMVYRRTGNR